MKRIKKMLAVVLSAALIITSTPPRRAEASWFSDFCGGLFTIITAPIWIFCQDNPTFRKNNPFRKKAWKEDDNNFPLSKNGTPKDDCKLTPRSAKVRDVKFAKVDSDEGGLCVNYNVEEQEIGNNNTIRSKHYTDFAKEYPQEWEQLKQEDSHHWDWIQYGIHRDTARILLVDSNGAAVTECTTERKQLIGKFLDIVERNSCDPYIISLISGGILYSDTKKKHRDPISTVQMDGSVNNKDLAQAQGIVDGLNSLLAQLPYKIRKSFGYAIWNPAVTSLNVPTPSFCGFSNKQNLKDGITKNFKVPEHSFLFKDIPVKEDK